jgi:hypothetical protein
MPLWLRQPAVARQTRYYFEGLAGAALGRNQSDVAAVALMPRFLVTSARAKKGRSRREPRLHQWVGRRTCGDQLQPHQGRNARWIQLAYEALRAMRKSLSTVLRRTAIAFR